MFKKNKKPPIQAPYKYARIIYTPEAIEDGNLDQFQKQIQIIQNNKIVEKIDYSEADIQAINKVYKIPIVDLTKMVTSELEFLQIDSFGEIKEEI